MYVRARAALAGNARSDEFGLVGGRAASSVLLSSV